MTTRTPSYKRAHGQDINRRAKANPGSAAVRLVSTLACQAGGRNRTPR